jgi:flagellar biosynthesis GTPase FlhF
MKKQNGMVTDPIFGEPMSFIVRFSVLVFCFTGSCSIFAQEATDRESLNLIREHFGSDAVVLRKSKGRFAGAADLIGYLSHAEETTGAECIEALDRMDAVKTAELKNVFGCEGEPSESDTDEISERREVIDLLVAFGMKRYINRIIRTLADRNRTLNVLKDQLAEGNDSAERQANLQEVQVLRAAARNLAQTLDSKILAALPEVLQQVPEADAQEVQEELYAQSGYLRDTLMAILADV